LSIVNYSRAQSVSVSDNQAPVMIERNRMLQRALCYSLRMAMC